MNAGLKKPTDIESRTLVDALLEEQRSLTAVERFARMQEQNDLPSQEKFYRHLIPLTTPAPGQQYGFEVDLDKCSGCKACVTACHALNGLEAEETWRDVGLLFSNDWRAPFQVSVTTACHHCVEPACLSGCPVLAYDKDPVTGIVRHLDDQCIGCQYCVMKCPYEVPQYSAKRGIVRKCDMCSSRLSQGEAPACVQACPSQAIRITLVDQREISLQFQEQTEAANFKGAKPVNPFLPSSPAPDYTIPTTRYKSSKPLPIGLLAGNHARVLPACAHLPLVFMLVLSQLAVGASIAAAFLEPAKWLALLAAMSGVLAIGIGTLHLGQPLKAWRAFLGWRTSWFSREVIVFGVFIPLAMLAAGSYWFAPLAAWQQPLRLATCASGLLGVACSAMIYADTRREFWRASQTFGKFFATTLLLGAGAALVVSDQHAVGLVALLGLAAIFKLGLEQRIFQHRVDEEAPAPTSLNKTARLLADELGFFARSRILCGVIGGVFLPILLAMKFAPGDSHGRWLALAAMAFCLTGELLERYLFFTAVAPATMPGGLMA